MKSLKFFDELDTNMYFEVPLSQLADRLEEIGRIGVEKLHNQETNLHCITGVAYTMVARHDVSPHFGMGLCSESTELAVRLQGENDSYVGRFKTAKRRARHMARVLRKIDNEDIPLVEMGAGGYETSI